MRVGPKYETSKASKLTTIQAWTERGLNPGGYLVCKYAFKVRCGSDLTEFSTDASISAYRASRRFPPVSLTRTPAMEMIQSEPVAGNKE